MRTNPVRPFVRCHYCDAEAAFAADSDGVRVGLCARHLRLFVEQCEQADLSTALKRLKES